MTEEKLCPICGTSFPQIPTRPNQKYCSKECAYEGILRDKEEAARQRVNGFIDTLVDLDIKDVLEGRLGAGTDNRMTVKGARHWQGCRFIVLAVVDEIEEEPGRREFYTVDEIIQGKRP